MSLLLLRRSSGTTQGGGGGGGGGGSAEFLATTFLTGFGGSNGDKTTAEESAAGGTIGFVGNTQVSTLQSKFGGTSFLSSEGAGSLAFENPFNLGNKTFDIQVYARFDSNSGQQGLLSLYRAANDGWAAFYNAGNLAFQYRNAASGVGTLDVGLSVSWTPTINTWYKLNFIRNGSNEFRFFVDDVQQGATQTLSNTIQASPWPLGIGSLYNFAFFTGYLDGVSITIDGTVVFSSGFEGTNGSTTFSDDSGNDCAFHRYGTGTSISTTTSAIGSSSLRVASSSSVTVGSSAKYRFGSDPFQIDVFVYFGATSNTRSIMSCYTVTATQQESGWILDYVNGTGLRFVYSATGISSGDVGITRAWSPSTNTWYHVRVSRDGSGNIYFGVDGSQLGATATGHSAAFYPPTTPLMFGGLVTANMFTGHIDEARIMIDPGAALWTGGSYTVPTAAFPRS